MREHLVKIPISSEWWVQTFKISFELLLVIFSGGFSLAPISRNQPLGKNHIKSLVSQLSRSLDGEISN